MGFRKLALSLSILAFLINLASTYAFQKTLPSEFMEKSKIEDKRINNGSKIEGGSNHGGTHGGNSNGNGDSGSPNQQGGNAVPAYAAGAANNNRQHQTHHGAANCNHNKIKIFTTLMITLVYPLILFFCFW